MSRSRDVVELIAQTLADRADDVTVAEREGKDTTHIELSTAGRDLGRPLVLWLASGKHAPFNAGGIAVGIRQSRANQGRRCFGWHQASHMPTKGGGVAVGIRQPLTD